MLGPLLFVIFFNDIVLELDQSKIIQYADDTFIFFADKDYDKVGRALPSDMNRLSEWFTENELLLNLKPSKTELLVFGTNQRLAMIPTLYKFRGVELTSSLNLNSQCDRNYTKISSRLKTLRRIRHILTNKSAKYIFSLMVLLTLL